MSGSKRYVHVFAKEVEPNCPDSPVISVPIVISIQLRNKEIRGVMFSRLFGGGSKSTADKTRFEKRIWLTDQGIRDNLQQAQFRIPEDLRPRLDYQVEAGIERAINGLKPSEEALARKKKANCMMIFTIIALVVGFMGGFPMTFVGAARGPSVVMIIGIIFIVFFVVGIVGFFYG